MQRICGTAAAGSTVKVVDPNGAILAHTIADSAGKWDAGDIALKAGDAVRADVREPSGRQRLTDYIEITATPAAPEPAPQVDDGTELRERMFARYVDMVGALVDGDDLDYQYFCDVAAAIGKTCVDVQNDIEALDRHKRLNRLEALNNGATL